MNDITADELEQELFNYIEKAYIPPAPRRPQNFGITRKEYKNKKNLTSGKVKRMLAEMVESGHLKQIQMRLSEKGEMGWVFYKPGTLPDDL